MSTRILVVWNCGAGSAEQCADIRAAIEQTSQVELLEFVNLPAAARRINAALADGVQRIIAAGGDGTVSSIAGLMARRNAPHASFAALPLGTGNDLARSLGMPMEPSLAWQVCLDGTAAPMDVLRVSHQGRTHIAANMVTAGNTGKYTAVITPDMKRRWGPLCYLRGSIDVLQELDVYDVRFRCSGDPGPRRLRALNVFVANGRTSGGGLPVAPDARLDDGLMDVVLIRDGDALDLAGLTADYLLSDYRDNELVVHRRCRAIRIAAKPPLPLSIDGDPQPPGNMTIRVIPAALNAVRGNEPLPGNGD